MQLKINMKNITKENHERIKGHLHILLGHAIVQPGQTKVWIPGYVDDKGESISLLSLTNKSTKELQLKINLAINKFEDMDKYLLFKNELNSLNRIETGIDMDDVRMRDDEYHGSKTRSNNYNNQRIYELQQIISEFEKSYDYFIEDLRLISNMIISENMLVHDLEAYNTTWRSSLETIQFFTK